jgi:nucleotide-binding universal stress UspA family protein
MKKVPIALDDDSFAEKVAELNYQIAKALNAETILLHVFSKVTYYSSLQFSPVMGMDNISGLMPESDEAFEFEKLAEGLLDKIKRDLSDDTIKTIVKSGDFSENLVSVARDLTWTLSLWDRMRGLEWRKY